MGYTSTGRPLYGGTGAVPLYGGGAGKPLYDAQKRVSLALYAEYEVGETIIRVPPSSYPTTTGLYNSAKTLLEAKTWDAPKATSGYNWGGSYLTYEDLGDGDTKFTYGLTCAYGYVKTSDISGETLAGAEINIGVGIETVGVQVNLGYFTASTAAITETMAWIMTANSVKAVNGLHKYSISATLDDFLFFTVWVSPTDTPKVPSAGSYLTEENNGSMHTLQTVNLFIT